MSYCPNCGAHVNGDASFCESCGTSLGNDTIITSQTKNYPVTANESQNVFSEYYIGVLKKYAVFNGRARRKEYWFFSLFSFLISLGLLIIDATMGTLSSEGHGLFGSLYSLAVLLPAIAVAIRRMHDVDKSGWFYLIPIYNFILLCTEGSKGPNRFGPDPKEHQG